MPAQLEAARQWLAGEQIKLRRQGQLIPWSLENQRDYWRELIDVLDEGDSTHSVWDNATAMTRQGYREILHLRRDRSPEP